MTKEQLNTLLQRKKGVYTNFQIQKPLSTKKNISDLITKTSRFQGRIGVEYANLKPIKDKGQAVNELSWGEWDIYPYTIKHKDKTYVRVSLVPDTHFDTEYFKNGQAVKKEDIQDLCLASNFNTDKEQPSVLTIDINNLEII